MSSPKIFISYSWSSEEHEAWVVNFSEQLMHAGIEVVLDKWELLPTHDAYKFMERMVNDSSIDKVLMICDEVYASKANMGGAGGVSTETQIISPAIYAGTYPEKFVAIVTQRDASGKAYVPTYYSSKIYIDFSNPAKESESFEELVRFIYGKPRYKKPLLGKAPIYLSDTAALVLGTTIAFNRAISALRDSKPYAEGAVEEYLTTFLQNLPACKISFSGADEAKKCALVTDSLSALLPYRNEMIQVFDHIARYSPTQIYVTHIHRFFESYIDFLFFQGVGRHTEWDHDNYKFLAKELFLYFTAILIKCDKLEILSEFLAATYFVRADVPLYGKQITDYSIFSWHLKSLDFKNSFEKLNKTNLFATMLNDRSGASGISFDDLLQSDVLLYVRAVMNRQVANDDPCYHWFPDTAVYVGYRPTTFELFARASSAKYFARVQPLLNASKATLEEFLASDADRLPKFGWQTLPITILLGIEKLGARP